MGPEGNTGYINGAERVNRYYNFGEGGDMRFLDDIPVQNQLTLGSGKTNDVKSPQFLPYRGFLDDVPACTIDRSYPVISSSSTAGAALPST